MTINDITKLYHQLCARICELEKSITGSITYNNTVGF